MTQETQETQEIDIRAWCIRIVKNWYWLVLSCAVCVGVGLLYYFSTTPKFSVESDIMIRNEDTNNESSAMQMMSMLGMSGSKLTEDEIAIFTSRDILSQVIRELDLQTEYRVKKGMRWVGQYPNHTLTVHYPAQYTDTMTRSFKIDIRVRKSDYIVKVKSGLFIHSRHRVKDLTQPIQTCVGEMYFTTARPLERGEHFRISTTTLLPCIDSYKQQINVEPLNDESYVICISATTDMPKRAIDFIKKETELYNLDAVIDKNLMASNTASFIEERLQLIENELYTAEKDVESYKEKNGIVDLSSEAKLYLTESTEYRKRVAEIETQLNLIQYIHDFVSDDSKQNSLIPANLGISDESLVGLITEYNNMLLQRMRIQRTATSDNPVLNQLDTQLALMRENILTSMSSVQNSLRISKRDLEKLYTSTESQKYDIPSQERQYVEVERRRQLKENLYLFLYEKREENALRLVSTVMPAKVIATPQMDPNPVSPKLRMILLICLLMGLCIPVGVMYLYDMFNNKLTDDTKAFEKRLKVPFLGVLVQNHHGQPIAVKSGEDSVTAELFRLLRTNLKFTLPADGRTPVILVTSSIGGEGKSYVASNLAISLSLLGKRIVLVGLDIRSPRLVENFGLSQKGYLTSYLAGDTYTIDELIVHSNMGVDIIPTGIIPPNPSELLQSERLDTLIAELRTRYDYIIVDSAPAALVSDTFLLNRVCDLTIFVSRARYTTTDMVDFINQTSEQQRLPHVVSVLNGVKASAVGYGYGYGYGASNKKHKR